MSWQRGQRASDDKGVRHSRRMETEAKAKVVASVWGAEFPQFLAVLGILPPSIWKTRMNSTFFSISAKAKQ